MDKVYTTNEKQLKRNIKTKEKAVTEKHNKR